MKQYRVVCTQDTHHNDTNINHHYEVSTVLSNDMRFKDKEQAVAYLHRMIERGAEVDKRNDNDKKGGIRYKHYNFRIQSREVTEWEDE